LQLVSLAFRQLLFSKNLELLLHTTSLDTSTRIAAQHGVAMIDGTLALPYITGIFVVSVVSTDTFFEVGLAIIKNIRGCLYLSKPERTIAPTPPDARLKTGADY
jgi:hypothetical protein